MRAYRWEVPGFPVLLECDKQDAAMIIRHFGPNAKGATLQLERNTKVSFYGLDPAHRRIAPVRMLSMVVPGHEIPESGPEITLALFLDEYHLTESRLF